VCSSRNLICDEEDTMMKRIKRSGLLKLSRMTVRDLSQSQLRGVVGGLPPDPTEPTISLDGGICCCDSDVFCTWSYSCATCDC
jgi:hypothetical protein